MRIEKQFTVQAPPDVVWNFLTDPYKVAACLPGAAITEKTDERSYAGTITVKVGPVATTYRGKVRYESLDAATHTAEITAVGQDVRGKGGADLRMTSTLVGTGQMATEVTAVQELNVTGILAQMGRGMIQDVGDEMFERFTAAMRAQLESAAAPDAPVGATAGSAPASTPGPEPIQALSLGASVGARVLARAVRRPTFWVVALVVVFLLWWLFR